MVKDVNSLDKMATYNNIPYGQTTYRDTFRSLPVLPPIKYKQPLSFQAKGQQHVEKREFPLIPRGPHRRLEIDRAPAIGIGSKDIDTERYLEPKPIIQTPPPHAIAHQTVYNTYDVDDITNIKQPRVGHELFTIGKDIVESLSKNVTWTSTTQRAADEAVSPMYFLEPPVTTFEENADMVKLRPKRYEENPKQWQGMASYWGRNQIRHNTERWRSDAYIDGSKPSKMWQNRSELTNTIAVDDRINDLIQNNKLDPVHNLQCPGYAGYVPRSAIDTPLENRKPIIPVRSLMKDSYRTIPSYEYRIKKYGHQGPLSHQVTLTSPYNPFNVLHPVSTEGR